MVGVAQIHSNISLKSLWSRITMSIQVNIQDEPNGRRISLMLTSEQYERAQRDTEYVQQLVHDYDANMHSQETESLQDNPLTEPTTEQYIDQESPSLFIWNEACILLLLTLYSEHREDFEKMRHKMVYDIIARKMCDVQYNVNGNQCQSKINSLKKHYKKIMDHNATSGNNRATWPYFDRMNELFGSTGWANPVALASEIGPTPNENTSPQHTGPKKRKFDYILEDYRKDMKKFKEERSKQKQENFNKFMLLKQQQHREKMEILQLLSLNNNK